MLILLNQSKQLQNSQNNCEKITNINLNQKTIELVNLIKELSIDKFASITNEKHILAEILYQRIISFRQEDLITKGSTAIFTCQTGIYDILQAAQKSKAELDFMQNNFRMLSGFYGMLRPLDYIIPIKLEMNIRLKNPFGKYVSDFWQDTICNMLNQEIIQLGKKYIINFATKEYCKTIDFSKINAKVITLKAYYKFEKYGDVKSYEEKKFFGHICNYIIKNNITDPNKIKEFNNFGYSFSNEHSTENQFVFKKD